MTDGFFDKAEENAEKETEQHPAFKWKEAGQVLKGTMTDIRVQGTKDGRINLLATIDEADTDKTWALWIGDSPKVLKDQMEDAAPGIGSLIYISYKGKRDTKDGSRSYHVHSVEAQTRDFELWSELTKERAQKALGAGSYGGGDNGIPANAPDESPF